MKMVTKKNPYKELGKFRKKLKGEEPDIVGKDVDILTAGSEGGLLRRRWRKPR